MDQLAPGNGAIRADGLSQVSESKARRLREMQVPGQGLPCASLLSPGVVKSGRLRKPVGYGVGRAREGSREAQLMWSETALSKEPNTRADWGRRLGQGARSQSKHGLWSPDKSQRGERWCGEEALNDSFLLQLHPSSVWGWT